MGFAFQNHQTTRGVAYKGDSGRLSVPLVLSRKVVFRAHDSGAQCRNDSLQSSSMRSIFNTFKFIIPAYRLSSALGSRACVNNFRHPIYAWCIVPIFLIPNMLS